MNRRHFQRGLTLLEVLVLIGLALVALKLLADYWGSSEIAQAQQCQAKLLSLGPLEQQCLLEIASKATECPQCDSYNAAIATYNAGVCKKYGTVSPYVCPVPQPAPPPE